MNSVVANANVDPRFPIGRFQWTGPNTPEARNACIEEIAAAPSRLRAAVSGLTCAQIETPYRPGGWTVRQVVHHVPESHMNAYVRLKLALTEDNPTIKPYDENAWAMLPDVATTPIEVSLALLDNIHARFVIIWRSLTDDQWQRTFKHPEMAEPVTLDKLLALYAWHGRHHVAHITSLRERMGW